MRYDGMKAIYFLGIRARYLHVTHECLCALAKSDVLLFARTVAAATPAKRDE